MQRSASKREEANASHVCAGSLKHKNFLLAMQPLLGNFMSHHAALQQLSSNFAAFAQRGLEELVVVA